MINTQKIGDMELKVYFQLDLFLECFFLYMCRIIGLIYINSSSQRCLYYSIRSIKPVSDYEY